MLHCKHNYVCVYLVKLHTYACVAKCDNACNFD